MLLSYPSTWLLRNDFFSVYAALYPPRIKKEPPAKQYFFMEPRSISSLVEVEKVYEPVNTSVENCDT